MGVWIIAIRPSVTFGGGDSADYMVIWMRILMHPHASAYKNALVRTNVCADKCIFCCVFVYSPEYTTVCK